jgi:hypothetical protein
MQWKTKKESRDSLYCGELESNLQYLQGIPVFNKDNLRHQLLSISIKRKGQRGRDIHPD